MPDRRDLRLDLLLDRYFDEVFFGDPAGSDLDTTDPGLASTVQRVHALNVEPAIRPTFENTLWENLMNATATAGDLSPHPIPAPAGLPTRLPSRSWPRVRFPDARRRWALAQAAMAALIIVGLLGIYFVLNNNSQPATPPPATPTATSFNGWTNFKGNAARTGKANAGPTGQPVELWRYQREACGGDIAAVGDTVYAGCGDGSLLALDAATGAIRWQVTGHMVGTEISVASGLVYVGGFDGVLYALDAATGAERWSNNIVSTATPDSSPFASGIPVDNGLLTASTRDGLLFGIDAATGAERWRYELPGQGGTGNPSIANGIVYVSDQASGVFAVDAETGKERWRATVSGGQNWTAVIADGIVYFDALSGEGDTGSLYAFDAESGQALWHRDEPIFAPAVSNGKGYTGSYQGMVSAFDASTGAEIWGVQVSTGNQTVPFGPEIQPVAVATGVVYVPGVDDQAVFALDAATGAELWRFPVDSPINRIAVADGVLYAATGYGSIYAIGGADNTDVPASPAATAQLTTAASPASADTGPAEFLWQTEGGSQPFAQVGHLTVAPDGNLWVPDSWQSDFQIFAPDGTYVESWGVPGSAEGQFDFVGGPYGMVAFAPDGSFYVSDFGNQRIQHFAADRTFLDAWGSYGSEDGQFSGPTDIAIDRNGNIFVCDGYRGDIQKFDANGNFLFKIGGQDSGVLEGPASIDIDAQGNVWIAEPLHHRIQAWDNDGNFLASWGDDGSLGEPIGLAFDAVGRMFVSDRKERRVLVLDPSGAVIESWSTPRDEELEGFGGPVTVDGQDNVYVSAVRFAGNGSGPTSVVLKYHLLLPPLAPAASPSRSDGATPTAQQAASPNATPTAQQAASPAAAPAAMQIEAELAWKITGGLEPLVRPAGAAIDDQGNLWVVDAGNNQIQIFGPDGGHLETWEDFGTEMPANFQQTTGGGYSGDIWFDGQGNIYVVESGSQSMTKFGPDRTIIQGHRWSMPSSDAGSVTSAIRVAVDRDGNFIMVGGVHQDATITGPNGELVAFDGDIWLATNKRPDPGYITVDSDGNIWVADFGNNRVVKFSGEFKFLESWDRPGSAASEFNNPVDVAVDEAGNVYVADFHNGRVQVFDPNGGYFGEIDPGTTANGVEILPYAIVLDGEGNIYVIGVNADDKTTGSIQKFRLPPLLPEATPTT